MPESLPMPIRILIKGSSSVHWVSWMGGPRADFAFPRAIEAQLLSEGRPCNVETITMTSEKASTILRSWQRQILGYSPDVIVLAYGHYECVHFLLPKWLERHAHSLKARPWRLGDLYRKVMLRPIWKTLARLQAALDSAVKSSSIGRRRANRVAAYLERYISQVQKIGSPLVYVFELPPPSSTFRTWFPGMTARMNIMNQTIAAMVTRVDKPNVRYFPVIKLIDEHCDGDLDVAIPDGFHYTPEMHGIIGTLLGEQIGEWADTQPHLAIEQSRD